jgi:outer membrane protein OmpA-like peptidoglycan-associated protein
MLKPLILFLFLASQLQAQLKYTIIKGVVHTEEAPDEKPSPIVNAKVVLFLSNGSLKEAYSDLKGIYSFSIDTNPGSIQLFVEIGKNTISYNLKEDEFIRPSKAVRKINIPSTDTITENFVLKKCKNFPVLLFKTNSAELVNKNELTNLVETLKKDETIFIQIEAHSDITEKPDVAKKRMAFVKTELIKKGISAKRISAKSFGSSQLMVTDSEIKKQSLPGDKEVLSQKNRRVLIKAV